MLRPKVGGEQPDRFQMTERQQKNKLLINKMWRAQPLITQHAFLEKMGNNSIRKIEEIPPER